MDSQQDGVSQMSVMTGSRDGESPVKQSQENFKRNLIMSQNSSQVLEES